MQTKNRSSARTKSVKKPVWINNVMTEDQANNLIARCEKKLETNLDEHKLRIIQFMKITVEKFEPYVVATVKNKLLKDMKIKCVIDT